MSFLYGFPDPHRVLSVNLNGMGKDDPGDGLIAGGGGQRAGIRVVVIQAEGKKSAFKSKQWDK